MSRPVIPPPPVPTQLIVFADDWGRHPSSSQHLIRELLPQYPTLWVNTTGTRKPRLSDIRRVWGRLPRRKRKLERGLDRVAEEIIPGQKDRLKVVGPLMYPGFRKPWQRRFNTARMAKAIRANKLPDHRQVVVTTLPLTADLVSCVKADRWIYYCVDDYSQWPGTDQSVMAEMESLLVDRVDELAPVSEVLAERLNSISSRGHSKLITHGVDLDLWNGNHRKQWNKGLNPNDPVDDPWWWYEPPDWTEDWRGRAVALFWGLIDARLDVQWLTALSNSDMVDRAALVGPVNAPPIGLDSFVDLPGKADHKQLPALAAAASVLIMPYIDAPVTCAMQPLKLLEYLATMKPVVVRDLPATRAWADCCDLAADSESFARLVNERIQTGTPPEQIQARKRRLANESWTAKAAQLAELINVGI